ncbi:MAG TPA: AmmeMemoRadiSam system protein B [Burkholderiales bacterium]|nr:AmmeMemoRadiSam system protein B [Burkholderiales bacterium]
MLSVRPAAVAGMFYPGEARALAAEVDDLLGGVSEFAPRLGYPKALIVPHAGYIYSGGVAARAYDELAPARGFVKRVVLLGPTHRVAVRGLAMPSAGGFATPLGTVRVDNAALDSVRDLPQVVVSDAAHAMEHSLEVQLPFLQKMLGDFALAPLAVGMASVAEVAEVIERLWGGPETLIVISTDMSHYHSYEQARAIDGFTIKRIAAFATDIHHEEACGATPLNGLLFFSRQRNLSLKLLAACNSGDTAGGKDRVVGYSAFGLYEGGEVSLDEAGRTLLSLARGSIETNLLGKPEPTTAASWLSQSGATFVTLTKEGNLRGCIGSLEAARALAEDVVQNALGAAFRDPRFPAMTAAEWSQCRVEVSLLSTPKPVRFADETNLLEQIEAGEDGLIVEADGRRATFLPQVWEDIGDKRVFLSHLLRKAGLPVDTRLTRCKISRYRVAKWKE